MNSAEMPRFCSFLLIKAYLLAVQENKKITPSFCGKFDKHRLIFCFIIRSYEQPPLFGRERNSLWMETYFFFKCTVPMGTR